MKCYRSNVSCIFLLAHMTNMHLFNSVICQGLSTHYVRLPSNLPNLQRPSHMFFEMHRSGAFSGYVRGGGSNHQMPYLIDEAQATSRV